MIPPPILPKEYWADLDASTFRIRSRNYIEDKIKIESEASAFRLIAVDVSKSLICHPLYNSGRLLLVS